MGHCYACTRLLVITGGVPSDVWWSLALHVQLCIMSTACFMVRLLLVRDGAMTGDQPESIQRKIEWKCVQKGQ